MIKMMIVDDESFTRECLKTHISWNQCDVEVIGTAKNGQEALDLMNTISPQIILTDVKMPKMNGITLMEAAKKVNPEIEFVLISGFQEFDYAKKALTYGASGYVLKPIETNELMEAVGRAANRVRENLEKKHSDNKEKEYIRFLKNQLYGIYSNDMNRKYHDRNILYRILMIYFCELHELYDQTHMEAYAKLQKIMQSYADKHLYELIMMEDNPRNTLIIFREADAGNLIHISDSISKKLKNTLIKEGIQCYQIYLSEDICLSEQLNEVFLETSRNVYVNMNVTVNRGDNYLVDAHRDILIALDKNDVIGISTALDKMLYSLEVKFKSMKSVQDYIHPILINLLKASQDMNSPIFYFKDYISNLITQIYIAGTVKAITNNLTHFKEDLLEFINKQQTGRKDYLVDKVKKYIDENSLSKNLSLQDLSEYANISPNYLSSIYSRSYGISITAYINQIHIEEAKKRLLLTEDKISVIAEEIGYENTTYFSTIFRKVVGMTPSEFRLSVKENKILC